MAKKKAVKYMADEEVQKDDFVKEVYDLISEKYYKYKKVTRENAIKYFTSQCKKLRKAVEKRGNIHASIALTEMPNKGMVQIIVAWHTDEEMARSYYFVHATSYIPGDIGPDCKKLGEF